MKTSNKEFEAVCDNDIHSLCSIKPIAWLGLDSTMEVAKHRTEMLMIKLLLWLRMKLLTPLLER